jgi:hypothetical protein
MARLLRPSLRPFVEIYVYALLPIGRAVTNKKPHIMKMAVWVCVVISYTYRYDDKTLPKNMTCVNDKNAFSIK